jgi:hypothetical protein
MPSVNLSPLSKCSHVNLRPNPHSTKLLETLKLYPHLIQTHLNLTLK